MRRKCGILDWDILRKRPHQVRHTARARHFSNRTEQADVYWIERSVRHFCVRHPETMRTPEVEAFLTHLAAEGDVAVSTQYQALPALLNLGGEGSGVAFQPT